jgi:hypothetical protein
VVVVAVVVGVRNLRPAAAVAAGVESNPRSVAVEAAEAADTLHLQAVAAAGANPTCDYLLMPP